MKKNTKVLMVAAFMVIGCAAFAGPHGRHHHHRRDGLDLAAGIVNLVRAVVAPPVVVAPPAVVAPPVVVAPPAVVAPPPVVVAPPPVVVAPPPRYHHYRPAPPPRHNRHHRR